MRPLLWMYFESLQRPIMRIHARKLHFFTEIVSSVFAEKTCPAGNARFECDSVACACLAYQPRVLAWEKEKGIELYQF